ncbi:MAG: hypothetical protein KGJ62_01660 [Armatimonadetes bacterium]|nr:hypothetical protein [Armatimonadota bacterium]MDE2205487.1 hypothetical protein [Armatimonadota bacterium]
MLAQNPDRRRRIQVDLGRLLATPAALEALTDAKVTPLEFIRRHQRGDWGEVCKADQEENELSLREGFRLLSAYTLPQTGAKIWIITEADRSVTTILLPEEY